MNDCFLAEVVSFNSVTFEGRINPLIIEVEGSEMETVTAKSVSGVTPQAGDVVLVVVTKNNLDNEPVSRFFKASETNGRIIAIVKKNGQDFVFTGNYKFKGNVEFDGDVTITGKAIFEDDVEIDGNLDVGGDTALDGDLDVAGNLSVDGTSTFQGIAFGTHTHAVTGVGVNTGPPV